MISCNWGWLGYGVHFEFGDVDLPAPLYEPYFARPIWVVVVVLVLV